MTNKTQLYNIAIVPKLLSDMHEKTKHNLIFMFMKGNNKKMRKKYDNYIYIHGDLIYRYKKLPEQAVKSI